MSEKLRVYHTYIMYVSPACAYLQFVHLECNLNTNEWIYEVPDIRMLCKQTATTESKTLCLLFRSWCFSRRSVGFSCVDCLHSSHATYIILHYFFPPNFGQTLPYYSLSSTEI